MYCCYQTARVNEAARLIYSLDAGFKEMKNGKDNDFSRLSRWVVDVVIICNCFYFFVFYRHIFVYLWDNIGKTGRKYPAAISK
jgi:hypothetical protein